MPIPQSVVNTNESAPRFSIAENVARSMSSQEIADLIAHAELLWLGRCGHMLTMEHPQAVAAAMQRWLQQHGWLAQP